VVGPRCTLVGGQWYSYYYNATWSDQADHDIDHVVALAEAWDSGAAGWTTARRRAFGIQVAESSSPLAWFSLSVTATKDRSSPKSLATSTARRNVP